MAISIEMSKLIMDIENRTDTNSQTGPKPCLTKLIYAGSFDLDLTNHGCVY